jgi:L-asparaginase
VSVKRILVIHTGGTFGMVPMRPSQTLAPGEIQDRLLAEVPEIERIARIDTAVAFNIDSSNITPGHWRRLATMLVASRDSHDGFVVIHGTDSMAYTASALSFMLLGFGKPVILTGSQRPIMETRSDARSNLVNAVEIATSGIAEVGVFFGTRLYRGNRTTKVSAELYDAFSSPNCPPLAEVGVGVVFSAEARRAPPSSSFSPFLELQPSVITIVVHPGLSRGFLERALDGPERAFVVEGYGPGNVPIQEESLLPFIAAARRGGKIVAMNSQCAEGRVSLDLYECGRAAAELGAIPCRDMTIEASITKMMYLLGRYQARAEVERRFVEEIAGELSGPPEALAEEER